MVPFRAGWTGIGEAKLPDIVFLLLSLSVIGTARSIHSIHRLSPRKASRIRKDTDMAR
jgi:hypothetical protein